MLIPLLIKMIMLDYTNKLCIVVIRGSRYISRFLTKVPVITFLLSHGEIHNMEIKINIIYIKYKFMMMMI